MHIQLRKKYLEADPYLLSLGAFLTGWGLITIWRLLPEYGARQALWLSLSGGLFVLGLRLSPNLLLLRRYKYIWLTGGLFLTALTLLIGTNPMGGEQRLWLGFHGFFIQPSESLKLLLATYLAAYFADRIPFQLHPLALISPTAIVTGIALLLLIVQRDLGTASIFIFLYTCLLFLATGKKRILLISIITMVLAGVVAYFNFDVVRLRIDAWLNPWIDPSGRSYQVVQALMAIANGGILGRGPGMGNPGLVPVAISDFIFTAIAEENGLVGTLGLLILIATLIARGMVTTLQAPDRFRRILAAGLTAYLGAQSLLIIGGNLRMLPLTGVTLPFVSYGGSSLLTSILSLLLLIIISSHNEKPAPLLKLSPYLFFAALFGLGMVATALANGWWAVVRGPDLLTRTDNARRGIADRIVRRGSLLDRNNMNINYSAGQPGELTRFYDYPDLAPVVGYINPTYGQAGLEASLDRYLRGLQGNPASLIWVNHLIYGQPPPGLDVRLSLELSLQTFADSLLGETVGSVILMNAESGEILVMASHPTFDPATLDENAIELTSNPDTPLVNRATQGMYPPGDSKNVFLFAAGLSPNENTTEAETDLYTTLGFYTTPTLRVTTSKAVSPKDTLLLSPLQMVIAASVFSNNGVRPAPRLAIAVNTPTQGWVILPALSESSKILSSESVNQTTSQIMVNGEPFWEWIGQASHMDKDFTWYLGGTMPEWQGTPLTLVVLLENSDRAATKSIGRELLHQAIR